MAACTCGEPTAIKMALEQKVAGNIEKGATKIDETLYGSAMGGSHGAIGPIRFCRGAPNEVSGETSVLVAALWKAAQLAIMAAQVAAQGAIHAKQQDLAEGYYDLAKFKWDRFAEKYIPLEKKLLNEVSTEPIKELDCDDDRQRAAAATNNAFPQLSTWLSQKAKALRVCIDKSVVNLMEHNRALVLADTVNYNLLDDQWFVDYSNDKRWNRRNTVLNLGRGLASNALQYGDVARTMLGALSNEIDTAAGSLMQAAGYYGSRINPSYPTSFLGQTYSTQPSYVYSYGQQGYSTPQYVDSSSPLYDELTAAGGNR